MQTVHVVTDDEIELMDQRRHQQRHDYHQHHHPHQMDRGAVITSAAAAAAAAASQAVVVYPDGLTVYPLGHETIYECAARLLFMAVKWSKSLPSFANLPFRDQVLITNINDWENYYSQMFLYFLSLKRHSRNFCLLTLCNQ